MTTYFDSQQLTFLVSGGLLLAISLLLFTRNKMKWSLWFLFASGALLFSFAASLDPFLNIWDERFHALVAKNMMNDPFVPMLYTEQLVDLDYEFWASASVWLHKQPLFLWQMALSFKCFGISEFTMRLPGVLMSAILVWPIFRVGKLLINEKVGYLAGFLWVTSFYLYELISGRQMLDQNDVAFVGYISLSIWAWVEYLTSGKKYWLVLIGLFSGAAVLCKWFVGLFVYLCWGVYLLVQRKFAPKLWLPLTGSFLITLAIAIPWQVYIFSVFPDVATEEWNYNTLHFKEAVEGHGGDAWFHLRQLSFLYGHLVPLVLLPGFVIWYRQTAHKKLLLGLIGGILGVELFFFLAATKMPSFTFILVLPVMIAVASFMDYLVQQTVKYIRKPLMSKVLIFVGLAIIGVVRLGVEELQEIHTTWKEDNTYTRMLTHNRDVFMELDKVLPENAVLFNVKGRHYVEAMFYTGNTAYTMVPAGADIAELKQKNRPIWIFKRNDRELPAYILNDPEIHKIDLQLQGYE